MDCANPPDFSAVYDSFLATPPSKHVRAVHSHVFPWIIKWCLEQRKRIPIWVHTHHAWYFDEYNNGRPVPWHAEFNHYFVEAINNCDIPLCVSRWQQQFMKREFGLKTHYVPNGVDLSLCLQGKAETFHDSMQMEGKFVLWVGRNDPVKNPKEIVQLALEFPELPFYLVGPGLSAESMQADYGQPTPKNVFYTGRLSQLQVQDAIAACSTLVVTSRREGLPTLVLEGLAHQKPIVVPNEDGCVEALGGEEFGQVYELGNIPSLKLALEKALASPPSNPRALQRVREEFDWPVIMRRIDRVYKGGTLD
jgi:glycosyltransferase involved in cell wall biosynthesis